MAAEERLLVPVQMARMSVWSDHAMAAVLCSAMNDHMATTASRYDGMRMCATVDILDPAEAVRELERVGGRYPIGAVLVPPRGTILLGDPYYHPVFEAAVDLGVPIIVHPSGAEGAYFGGPTLGVGPVRSSYLRGTVQYQVAESNLFDLVFSGTFERYRQLCIIFAHWGYRWVPPAFWRMESEWRAFRLEAPWLTRSPWEYLAGNVRLACAEALHTEQGVEPSPYERVWEGLDPLLLGTGVGLEG
ncbi:MAG: amidohydrolase family protein [Actinobacteria bacterium]|nr:amidohydrolase family protein [Actinomycetota bacterium]